MMPIADLPKYISEMTNGQVKRSLKTIKNWEKQGKFFTTKLGNMTFANIDSVNEMLGVSSKQKEPEDASNSD